MSQLMLYLIDNCLIDDLDTSNRYLCYVYVMSMIPAISYLYHTYIVPI